MVSSAFMASGDMEESPRWRANISWSSRVLVSSSFLKRRFLFSCRMAATRAAAATPPVIPAAAAIWIGSLIASWMIWGAPRHNPAKPPQARATMNNRTAQTVLDFLLQAARVTSYSL